LCGNYTYHSFQGFIFMILFISDITKYVDTVFQCRLDVFVVKCDSVLHSRQMSCMHKADPHILNTTWKRFWPTVMFEIYVGLS
jgi:hypothetical protein